MVQESVEDGGGKDVVAEDCAPFGEVFVAGDDGGSFLLASADQLEEHVGFVAVEPEVADFVDDQQ